jgi:hypothetical protein
MLTFGLQNLRFRKIAFFYYSLVSIFSVPSRLIQDNSTLRDLLFSLLIGSLITTIALPMLWLVCYLNQRYQLGRSNILYPLGLVALVGAIRGLILHNIIKASDLDDNLEPIFAVISSLIFTVIYFIIISTFMETVLQRKEKFNRVFSEATLLIADPDRKSDTALNPQALYASTLTQMKEKISTLKLSDDEISHDALVAASHVIQVQINEVLRPLSHRLWVNGMGQVKHRGFIGILGDAIKSLDFNVKYILAYQLLVGGYGISLVLGFNSALYVSAIGVATSAVLIKAYQVLRERIHGAHFFLGLGFLILEGLVPVFLPIAIRNPLNESASALGGILISPTLPGLILLVSAYRLVMRDRDFAIGAATAVRFQVATATSEDKIVRSGIELAEYLHNSLQSELFGIAKRLEGISGSEGAQSREEVIRSLDTALSREYQEISTRDLDVSMRIPQLISSWEGIAAISISGLDLLNGEKNLSHRASSALEEMITNTIRYGDADEIEITLTMEGSQLHVLLTHNGKGEVSKKSGLGSLLLTHHSEAGLKINSEGGKTSLRIALPNT